MTRPVGRPRQQPDAMVTRLAKRLGLSRHQQGNPVFIAQLTRCQSEEARRILANAMRRERPANDQR